MTGFLRPLNHTGPTAYVWSGAVGSTTDLTKIDPKIDGYKNPGYNQPGRPCVAIYVGSAGNLVLQVAAPDGYGAQVRNVYYAGLPAGYLLEVQCYKILASGNVQDWAPGFATSAKTSTAKDLVVYWEV